MKSTLIGLTLLLAPLCAQNGTLRGVVTDDSGALVPGAAIQLSASQSGSRTATANPSGAYVFLDLAPGAYTAHASAPGLALARPHKIAVKGGTTQVLDLRLTVAAITEKMNVTDSAGPAVSIGPSSNSSALILTGDDLDALSDDITGLADDLMALAGPSAGPDGGSIFVDGFSGGELPPKDSIREIRINQNPFSPEYDKLGFGRIEIFTKPGSDRYRGTAFYNFGDSFWNSRNPYASERAPFLLKEFGGNVGGPAAQKASFFADIRRDATDNSSILNGVSVDPTSLIASPFNGFFVVPQRALRGSGRFDIQLTLTNTLTGRYAVTGMDIPDAGIGGFNLVERGYDVKTTNQTVQLSDTAVLGAGAVNEVRFQFFHSAMRDRVNTIGPAFQVLGSFTAGGANTGAGSDVQSSFEGQEYVSILHGPHTIRFGARLRGLVDDSFAPQNFNGTFSFNGSQGPQLNVRDQPIAGTIVSISSIEQYRRTLLFASLGDPAMRSLGGGPSQFTIANGEAGLFAGQFDLGAFLGDDWRVKPNFTLSLGARYETQTNMRDGRDFAPRLGFAWAPGSGAAGKSHTVIRGGFGVFYDRFSLSNTIAEERYSGKLEQQFVVAHPTFFPDIPTISSLSGGLQSTQVVQRISSSLRAPYLMQSAIGVERQLGRATTLAVTYANSHGLHLLRSRDINAPIVAGAAGGLYPYGPAGPIFLTESAGLYNQNQLILNLSARFNRKVSLNGSYVLNRALSNTDGLGTFPANQYAMTGEYGPAATDIRHRALFTGSIDTRWNVRFSPLVILQSGTPFNIISGQDTYGTTLYNSRPGIAADPNKSGLVSTAYGLLDPNPTPGETILGRNSGMGPGLIRVNLRVAKTFGFGPSREGSPTQAPAPGYGGGGQNRGNPPGVFSGGGGGGLLNATPVARRYNLIVSMQADNVLNHNNPGPIIGNITSPLFGQANQPAGARDLGGGGFSEAANNRRLELQLRLNF